MTASQRRNPKFRSRIVLGCVIASVLAVGVLLVGGVAYLLLRPHPGRDILTARLSAPQTGQQAWLGLPVDVVAVAAGLAGTSRVEVYADGALILARDSAGMGETELTLSGNWIPLTKGRHALMARGYGSKKEHADSEIVYVDVQEAPASTVIYVDAVAAKTGGANPSLDTLAQYLGTTTDELRRRNPSLGGSSGSEPLPPGSRVDTPPRTGSAPPPPGGSAPPPPPPPPPPPSPGLPAAPTELAGSAADCFNAVLSWRASPDAQTYRVYRFDAGSARAMLVADGLTTTSHSDPLPAPGEYWYQVASVRDGDEGLSVLLWVPRPATCPVPAPPPGTVADLVLTIAMVQTDALWDGIACFITVNGRPEERIPAGDFMYAPSVGDAHYYDLTALPGGGRQVDLNGQPLSDPVTLGRECQGKTGAMVETLGTFSASHPQPEWDGRLLTARGGQFSFSYCIGPRAVACTPTIPTVSPPEPPSEGYAIFLPDLIFYFPPPSNVRYMPGTDVWAGVDSCSALPDPIDQADCLAAQTAWGREMILWDWQGIGGLYTESLLTGYTVQRTNLTTRAVDTWEVSRRAGGSLPKRYFSTNRDMCGARAEYRVLAHTASAQSAWSDPVSLPTLPCPSAADLTITFDTLHLFNVIDQGEECLVSCNPDNTLEVAGNIHASGGAMAPTMVLTSGSHGISLGGGTRSWSSLEMFPAHPYIGHEGTGNNVFRTRISDPRQTITFGTWLSDIDTAWDGWGIIGQQVICTGDITLPARDLREWGSLNTTYEISNRQPQANCVVTVRVTGVTVP
jgi:hypothetical protein